MNPYHDLGTDIVHSYTYDQANRILDFDTTTGTAFDGHTYQYDDAGQLTEEAGGGVTSGGGDYEYSNEFAYDANGNRTDANGDIYVTIANNHLQFDGTFTYAYDNNGNRTARFIDSGNGVLDGGDTAITEYGPEKGSGVFD